MAITWQELKDVQNLSDIPKFDKLERKELDSLEHNVEKKLKEKEHKARGWLTIFFIVGLFILIFSSAIYVMIYNSQVIELAIKAKENNITLIAENLKFLSFESLFSLLFNAFGTSLGFIIGYYFKDKSSK